MNNGTLEQVGSRWRLRFVRRLAHPQKRVWQSLTEHEHLSAWFPSEVLGERTTGAKLTFRHAGQDFPETYGEVVRCEPPSLLEFTWGGETVSFEVEPDGSGSVLTLLVTLAEQGTAARDGAGWHECLDLLEVSLDGGRPWPLGQHWAVLGATYAAAFGPGASAIGPPEGWRDPSTTTTARS